ncbi:MAG: XRE family transcriptional regulator, partial [Bacillota bacterium]|nr:XRE family transcriptional regulator [Bacillota bacterium]
HQNITASFNYQTALIYAAWGEKDEALSRLEKFLRLIRALLKDFYLHGDNYFTELEQWIEGAELGATAPRNKKLVWESALQGLEHPGFNDLREDSRFKHIRTALAAEGEKL